MDQRKIGHFIKNLRNEKGITQEQLGEILGVSNRSISRWENGINLPDLELLIEVAEYFQVGIKELLDGERAQSTGEEKPKEAAVKIAEYSNYDKLELSRRHRFLFLAGLAAFIVYMIIDVQGMSEIPFYDNVASAMLGIVLGVLLTGVLYTSRYMAKIRAFKMRLLHWEKR